MLASRAVRDFIRQSKDLLRVLEGEGQDLSEIELHMLLIHLNLLLIESTNLQTSKTLQSQDRAA